MKKLFLIAFTLGFLFLFGCIGEETEQQISQPTIENEISGEITTPEEKTSETKETTIEKTFGGFIDWQEGMWVKLISNEIEMETSIVEKKDGIIKFQTVSSDFEFETISQMWFEEDTMEISKYITKVDNMVICYDIGEINDNEIEMNDEEYFINKIPELGYGTYTTPTGKTITVAKFKMGNDEVWVSEEIPFGIVKITYEGVDQTYLQDFGISQAENKITNEEIANCMDLSSMIMPS